MIKVKLQDMMWEKRIRTLAQLVRDTGISRTALDRLYNKPEMVEGIQFKTLDRLCKVLHCNVQDLIEYVGDGE